MEKLIHLWFAKIQKEKTSKKLCNQLIFTYFVTSYIPNFRQNLTGSEKTP